MKVDRRELSRRHTDYRLLVSAAPPDCIISPQFASRENGATMGRGGGAHGERCGFDPLISSVRAMHRMDDDDDECRMNDAVAGR